MSNVLQSNSKYSQENDKSINDESMNMNQYIQLKWVRKW